MSLSALKEKIVSEAVADAERISREHDLALQEKKDRAIQELRVLEEGMVASADKEGNRQAKIIHQQAELAGRSSILQAKQDELHATKEAFLSLLLSCTDQEKKEIRKVLESLVPKGEGSIEDDESGIGLLFTGKGIQMDLTVVHLVDQLFRKYRAQVANELFN